jgi:DNA-binding ferritin-like protein
LPTIHLSLPESLYEELRRKADDMGVQITDLVKFFIKQGIEGKEDNEQENGEQYEESVAFLEAKVAQLDTMVSELVKKIKLLEEEGEEDTEEIEIKRENS